MAEKSDKLETDVWSLDRCSGCGMCLAACSKGVLSFTETHEHPTKAVPDKMVGLSHTKLDTCFFCDGDCAESCHRLAEWSPGEMLYVASARTTRRNRSGARNDVVADLLCSLLRNGFIDGAVVMDMDRWTLRPRAKVATSVAELAGCSGSQYIWTPILEVLREAVHDRGLKRLAVVGTPCVAQAIKKVKASDFKGLKEYRDAVQLVVGVFCSGVFSYSIIPEVIVKGMKIPIHEIKRVKGSTKENKFTVTLRDGSKKVIPLEDVRAQKYTRKGCVRCGDFAAEQADISIGDVGAKDGYSTVIARDAKGLACIQNSVDWGFLEVDEEVDMDALKAAREEKMRRKKVQLFDSLFILMSEYEKGILMLDALADPTRIEETRKRFGEVYEVKVEEMPNRPRGDREEYGSR